MLLLLLLCCESLQLLPMLLRHQISLSLMMHCEQSSLLLWTTMCHE